MFAWHNTPWMWLSMILFWLLLIVLAYFVIRALVRSEPAESRSRSAEILEERYAQGEISAEEYRERRETLVSSSSRGT